MNTLMGVKGRDFVLLGGDSAFFRSVVIMNTVSPITSCLKLSMLKISRTLQVSCNHHQLCVVLKQQQQQQQEEKEEEW